MYLWNLDTLAARLKARSLTEREKFTYLFAVVISYTLAIETVSYLPSRGTTTELIGSTLVVAITAAGTFYCFRANQNGDGEEFVVRYICLGWVLLVRLFVLSTIAMLLIYGVLSVVAKEIMDELFSGHSIGLEIIVVGMVTLIYYVWLASEISMVALSGPPVPEK